MDKKYIIVAEDDVAYSHAYKTKLEAEGFEVTVVLRGSDVVPAVRKRKPDLLIQDLIMPEKAGFEILAELHKDEDLKSIPVLVVSNLSQESDLKKVSDLGYKEYFIKSDVSIADLVKKIKSLIGH